MIRSLSPFYVTVPFVSVASGLTCTDYTLYIYVWTGAIGSVPGTATYEVTKPNPTGSTGNDKINIARLIADYIEFAPVEGTTSGQLSGGNTMWIQTEYTYTTTDPTDATTPQGVSTTTNFSRGWTYGIGGENDETVTGGVLFQGTEFKVSRTSFASYPIILSTTATTDIDIISYPDNEINFTFQRPIITNSAVFISYLWVNLSETTTDTYVELSREGVVIATLLIQDEYKYTPVDIFFQNKDGFQQSITFFKERIDSITINSSEFESDREQPSDGNHQFVTFNVQGEQTFKVNSGFLDESNNETVQQLLLSERIWHYDGTDFIPLNIKTTSKEWKTQLRNKLINHEIEFKCSYNVINNI